MPEEPITYPYRIRREFLSPAESAFYHVLQHLVDKDYFVCPKVALVDLFFVTRPNENVQYGNRLVRKNVDFLLLRADTLVPVLAVELDYPKQVDHRPQDNFLDGIFQAARFPLIHVMVQQTYNIIDLKSRVHAAIAQSSDVPLTDHNDYSPICPRCGITMVLRFDKNGPQNGQKYYGCLNFPECQELVALEN